MARSRSRSRWPTWWGFGPAVAVHRSACGEASSTASMAPQCSVFVRAAQGQGSGEVDRRFREVAAPRFAGLREVGLGGGGLALLGLGLRQHAQGQRVL